MFTAWKISKLQLIRVSHLRYPDKTLQPVALVNRDELEELSPYGLCPDHRYTVQFSNNNWRNALYVTVCATYQTTLIPSIGLDHVYPLQLTEARYSSSYDGSFQ